MELANAIPDNWKKLLKAEIESEWFIELQVFLDAEWRRETVYPPREKIFSALRLTPPEAVKVLILGQDPYHGEGQAHGLCFSVPEGVRIPPSLRNIYKEMHTDLKVRPPEHGCLESWARQGVLLLNTVLTVRAGQAQSHQRRGWEKFTDAIIRQVNAQIQPGVFVLWGGPAQKKLPLIDRDRHRVICSAHPSPLSASRGFLGSRPFTKINQALTELRLPPVKWTWNTLQLEFEF
ncbi:MAG: uracil-DNA glycosylase [Victivallales bacterium]|nr:uracil-DNA glycosylase [Victivallales bacterium]